MRVTMEQGTADPSGQLRQSVLKPRSRFATRAERLDARQNCESVPPADIDREPFEAHTHNKSNWLSCDTTSTANNGGRNFATGLLARPVLHAHGSEKGNPPDVPARLARQVVEGHPAGAAGCRHPDSRQAAFDGERESARWPVSGRPGRSASCAMACLH